MFNHVSYDIMLEVY